MMKPVRRNPSSAHVLTLKTVALAAAIGVSSMAWASSAITPSPPPPYAPPVAPRRATR